MGTETVTCNAVMWDDDGNRKTCDKPVRAFHLCDGHRDVTVKEYRDAIRRHYAEVDALTIKLRQLGVQP